MMASRGMGAVNKGKIMRRKDGDKFTDNGVIKSRRDGDEFTMYAEGGEVWDKPRPKGLGTPQKLSPAKRAKAKASAQRAGRPYPNLVDNMQAAKK